MIAGSASNNFYRSHGTADSGRDPQIPEVRRRYALTCLDLALRRLGLEPPPGLKEWRPLAPQPKQRHIFRARFHRPTAPPPHSSRASFLLKAWQYGDRAFPLRGVVHDVDLTVADEGATAVSPRLVAAFAALSDVGLYQFPMTARDPVAFAGMFDMFPQMSGIGLRDGATILARARLGDPSAAEFRALRHYEWPRNSVAAHLAAMEEEFGPLVKAVTLERGIPGVDRPGDLRRKELIERGFQPTPRREVKLSVIDFLGRPELDGFYVTRAFLTKPQDLPFTEFYSASVGLLGDSCVVSSIPAEEAVRIMPRFDDAGVGIDKGVGSTVLARAHGFENVNLVAYMDGPNDIPLRDVAGYSACVANGVAELLTSVDEVIPAMVDDGVAVHIERTVSAAATRVLNRSDWSDTSLRQLLDQRRITR